MRALALLPRMVGTFLWAFVVGCVAWYLLLAEGWAKDLDSLKGK